MINYDILTEAIKLDPKNIQSQLQNPEVQKLLKIARSRIHRNPYLRDKFYDTETLYHMTKNKKSLKAIKKLGIEPRFDNKKIFNNTNGMRPLVYTSKKPYRFSYDDDFVVKIRLPKKELLNRVPDPIEQRNLHGGHSYMNYFGRSVLRNDPVLKGKKMLGRTLDINDILKNIEEKEGKKVTLKDLRRRWAHMSRIERRKFINEFGGYYPAEFFPDTVALTSKIKPEWIVKSTKKPVRYSFEDQLKKDPERTTKIINDLMKRYK